MNYLALFLIAAAVAYATPKKNFTTLKDLYGHPDEGRIISGQPAKPGQFPWQVAVYSKRITGTAFCGGALINEKWILTAAHCTSGAQSFTLHFGKTSLKRGKHGNVTLVTNKYVTHPGYDPGNLQNDIALIKIEGPLEINESIQTIKLPKKGSKVQDGQMVIVSGWGRTSDEVSGVSNDLNYVALKTISNEECAGIYGSAITSGTLCCIGNPEHSTCNGDSGGPLIIQDSEDTTHVGVVSFVHREGCGSGNPSGYVRTESYLNWINMNTGIEIITV